MATYYWVGGSGNWNSTNTANWSTSSGGPGGAGPPVTGDDVVFDAGSDAGAPFTVTVVATGPTVRNFTASGLDFAMGLAGTTAFAIRGSISLPATNFTWSATGAVTAEGTAGSWTIQTNGVTINSALQVNQASGSWTLQSALTISALQVRGGTFDTAGYSVTTLTGFTSSYASTRAVTLGTSTVTVGTDWSFATTTNLTFSGASSTIVMNRAGTGAKAFSGGGLTYGVVVQNTAGRLTFSGSNTFFDIQNGHKATGASSLRFTAGTTTTVTNFTAAGEAGRVLTIDSSSAGSAFTLSKASGAVVTDYLSLKDSTATGGAVFYAGANSTDVSGNTGWLFTGPPGGAGNFFMFFG
jgi:hypothetical protein